MDVILMNGAPGTGKTTVGSLLHEHYKSPWFEFGWIPEFRRLNPHTEISYEEESALSFENLLLVVGNYLNHGYKNIIISDLTDRRILGFANAFSGLNTVIVTLYCDDETIKNRVLNRDNGNEYRNWEEAFRINREIRDRPPLPNEYRIDTAERSPEEIRDEIIRLLNEYKSNKE